MFGRRKIRADMTSHAR